MNIGEFIRTDNGCVTGYIAETHFDFGGIYFRKVASDNPDAPAFDMMAKSPAGRDVRLGSVWERTARGSGEIYFSGYIDTSLSGFIALRIFQSRQDAKVWNVARHTARRRKVEEAGLSHEAGTGVQKDAASGKRGSSNPSDSQHPDGPRLGSQQPGGQQSSNHRKAPAKERVAA